MNDPLRIPKKCSDDLIFGVSLLSHSLPNFLLTGYRAPFHTLSLEDRTNAVNNLLHSSLETLRVLGHSLKSLICIIYFSTVPEKTYQGIDPTRVNINWAALDYPGPDPNATGEKFLSSFKKVFKLAPLDFSSAVFSQDRFIYNEAPTGSLDPVVSFLSKLATPYRSLSTFTPRVGPLVLYTDVLIVGSGSGGGVAADTLAKSGRRVLVLEKGSYVPTEGLTLLEEDAMQGMYESSAFLNTNDNSMAILAGSTFGGGSAVNWSMCLDTPAAVREEWARSGLPLFTSPLYRSCMQHVKDSMGVHQEGVVHNGPNSLLLEGAEKLGYPVRAGAQNTHVDHHDCGWCCFGCRYGEKQGTNHSFLKTACERGARVIVNCRAERVLYSSVDYHKARLSQQSPLPPHPEPLVGAEGLELPSMAGSFESGVRPSQPSFREPSSHRPSVTGILASVTLSNGRVVPLHIVSPVVVVSAGSLHSPLLLKRSGVVNPHIGQHLYLHPVCGVGAIYKQPVNCYQGSQMTIVCDAATEDGSGFGCRIETPSIHPGLAAFALKWSGGVEFKNFMLNFNHIAPLICLTRDRDTGSVSEGAHGRPSVDYRVSAYDKANMMKAMKAAIRIHVAAGCTEVLSPQYRVPSFKTHPELREADPALERYLQAVEHEGIAPGRMGMFSAHQMGTCRMAAKRGEGVVRASGESWDVNSLYVCDASVMPSSSGTNPMITTMAIAKLVSLHIDQRVDWLQAHAKKYNTVITSQQTPAKL